MRLQKKISAFLGLKLVKEVSYSIYYKDSSKYHLGRPYTTSSTQRNRKPAAAETLENTASIIHQNLVKLNEKTRDRRTTEDILEDIKRRKLQSTTNNEQ